MSKKKDGVIGFDPLAWMKGGSPEATAPAAPSVTAPVSVPVATPPVAPVAIAVPTATANNDVLSLGETLTIEQAAAMHAELGRHLGATSVAIDAGALQRVDAAGLQLLVAFARTAQDRGTRVEWRSPSVALRDGARRLGLSGALGLS